MTSAEILAANPTAILIELINPYAKTLRYVLEDENGQRYCEPPRGTILPPGFKMIYRRKMGRRVI